MNPMEFSIGLLFYGSTLLHTQSRIACFIKKSLKALVLMTLPSVMLYSVQECNPKQCQWGPHPEADREQADCNSLLESDPLSFFVTEYPSCKRSLTQCHFCDTRSHLLCRFWWHSLMISLIYSTIGIRSLRVLSTTYPSEL